MRIADLQRLVSVSLACLFLGPIAGLGEAAAQNIIVLVNDEPITSFDVAQRQRWIARTSAYGDRMKALLGGDAIKERFRQLMIAANPRSEAEAKVVAERIKKQLVDDAKHRVLTEGGESSRKTAIDALIEDKLKLQAAKKLDIKITDKEVEETLAQRAGISPGESAAPSASSGSEEKTRHKKGHNAEKSETPANAVAGPAPAASTKSSKLDEFFAQFESDGINRKTIKEIIRAQLAWRDVIRKQYGPRLASLMAAAPSNEPKPGEGDVQFDVRVLRLAVKGSSDQKAVSQRILEAENLKEKFTSCADLPKQAQLVADATVKSMEKTKLLSFPKDVQPLIEKASEGQMTPPVLVGDAVESYAVCRKAVISKQKAQGEQKPDVRQQEYERFSRRYLQEIRHSASIDYRGT